MKRSVMLVGTFELNPALRGPNWAWLELYSFPERCHLKRNRIVYHHLLFRRGALGIRTDSRKRPKSSLKTETKAGFNCFLFECTLADIVTVKNSGVLS